MMKRANIGVRGNVQMAGFRTFIKNAADSLNVKGFAENTEDGNVRVICEGEEKGINELIDSIKEKPPSFARIEEVNVEYEEYKGEFTTFERIGTDIPKEEKEDAMLRYMKSFDKKGEVMIGILSSMNETLKSVKEDTSQIKQDTSQMLEKQDMMLDKQDMMLDKQDMMLDKQDMMLDKQDMMLDKQDDTIGEIRGLRQDLKSYMEERFDRLEREIDIIKAKLEMT
jgi:acylphosphatase